MESQSQRESARHSIACARAPRDLCCCVAAPAKHLLWYLAGHRHHFIRTSRRARIARSYVEEFLVRVFVFLVRLSGSRVNVRVSVTGARKRVRRPVCVHTGFA